MKLTLMIEGSAATIAAVLAGLPIDAEVTQTFGRAEAPNAPVNVTNVAPTSMPATTVGSPPMPSAPIQTADDDDDGDPGIPTGSSTDSTGLPWDERIHASTRTQTAKGVWKKRKSVDDATMQAVEAELRGASQPQASAPAMPAPVAMPMMPVVPTAAPVAMPMSMPVAQPEPEPMPVAIAAAPAGPSFPEFMQVISSLMAGATPKLTTENLMWLAGQLGLNAVTDLSTQPEKIAEAVSLLRQYGMWAD